MGRACGETEKEQEQLHRMEIRATNERTKVGRLCWNYQILAEHLLLGIWQVAVESLATGTVIATISIMNSIVYHIWFLVVLPSARRMRLAKSNTHNQFELGKLLRRHTWNEKQKLFLNMPQIPQINKDIINRTRNCFNLSDKTNSVFVPGKAVCIGFFFFDHQNQCTHKNNKKTLLQEHRLSEPDVFMPVKHWSHL